MTGKELAEQMAFASFNNGGTYGLTKREHFAALMMAALVSSGDYQLHNQRERAAIALEHADALLDALAGRPSDD